jgi:type IV pilus assembly protein PilP
MKRSFWYLTAILLLIGGCAGDAMDDLRDFVKNAHADKKPKIEPLPEIKPYEAFAYAAAELADPFSSTNLTPRSMLQARGGGPRPDVNRRKEPLEDYPLDALKMVGTLARGKQVWAIIQDKDGGVHRVQKGNYIGQNFGRITRVSEDKVDLVETVQGALGDWVEREASLAIQEQ